MNPIQNVNLHDEVEDRKTIVSSYTTPIAFYPLGASSPPVIERTVKRPTITGSMASILRLDCTVPCLWEGP